ncbi:CdaR family transcriptional regulator [Bacillus thermotolerans]|uniref:Sugar diacid utilization regulator SdaR n=1 Tax=Bacillus thermotolerans TaxID=1221996 RepID=A0A0F5I2N0_BACTR|nr:sugar diacid recognition domain-containing protein [Bacillus thermotolerans]KKB39786.1 Sugar diacid utilization regulator SdaR [Bacillus thermotolerans]KKB44220.1 Sugar diacid utilization regulator SdaR [Bacillus thermotolerans]
MKFFEQIAQSIVDQASSVLDVSISITNAEGVIIGCNDLERIGSYHAVTEEVIKAGRSVVFTRDKIKNKNNVLPGVATPVRFQQQLIGVLGIIGEPEQVERYVKFVQSYVEMMLRESFRAESFYIQMKTTELFIQHLIHFKEWDNEETLENYCEMSGFHFRYPRLCILIDMPHLQPSKGDKQHPVHLSQYDLFLMLSDLFEDHPQDIISPINPKQWIVLKYVKSEDFSKLRVRCEGALKRLKQLLKNHSIPNEVCISYGNSYTGFSGVGRSYRQAERTLEAGRKQKGASSSVFAFNDWDILLNTFIQEVSTSFSEDLDDYLAQLLSHSNAPVLAKTFLVYCEQGMNVSQAARELYVHRNTLLYRLNQLSQILNMDIQSFEQCTLLYLALKQNKEIRSSMQVI